MSISSVPLRRSSAMRRMVTTGTTRKERPLGACAKSCVREARSACQKPPFSMKKTKPSMIKPRQITT
jgi:hypothetical protein